MNSNQPPVFRKSMHGYNKEDVNAYISNMSRMFFEKEREYQSGITACKTKMQEDEKILQDLQAKLNDANIKAAELDALQNTLRNTEEQLQKTSEELDALKKTQQQNAAAQMLDDPVSMIRSLESCDIQVAAQIDELSIRAGKIMVAAQSAAEAIIQKARAEAEEIIRGANDRKERIFNNITATADTVMTDISSYMKDAVDKCFQEIYNTPENSSASRIAGTIKNKE